MRKNQSMFVATGGVLTLMLGGTAVSQAAVLANYTNVFSSSVADFTSASGTGGSWTLDTVNGKYINAATNPTSSAITSTAAVEVSNLGGTL